MLKEKTRIENKKRETKTKNTRVYGKTLYRKKLQKEKVKFTILNMEKRLVLQQLGKIIIKHYNIT